MKKIICLILIFALCISFAACSSKDKNSDATTASGITTTLIPPVIEAKTYSKEFKNEKGKVVFTVDVSVPQITENATEEFTAYIDKVSLDIFNEACEYAEKNIENASNFMKSNNSDKPWSKKIAFDTTYSNGRYLCFLINERFSMLGGSVEPTLKSICFDVLKGEPCTLFDFTFDYMRREDIIRIIVENVLCPRVSKDLFDGEELTDEQMNILHDTFDTDDFYLFDGGMGFYFNKSALDPNATGTYRANCSWKDIDFVLAIPEE